jgi:hypothetical protein
MTLQVSRVDANEPDADEFELADVEDTIAEHEESNQ